MLQNVFKVDIIVYVSIDLNYDYSISYMENIARNFTKKYPSYLIHKKSEDKIKAFLTDRMKAKVENFVNAEAKNVTVTEVREIADLIAEYEGTETPSPYGSHPADAPSLGSTGVELAMSVDTGASDIRPVNVAKPAGASGEAQDNKAECYPCNSGVGSADGNQAIPAIPATSSGPVQPA